MGRSSHPRWREKVGLPLGPLLNEYKGSPPLPYYDTYYPEITQEIGEVLREQLEVWCEEQDTWKPPPKLATLPLDEYYKTATYKERLRGGTEPNEGMHHAQSLASIARELGVTRERVRQIEQKALKKLRREFFYTDQGEKKKVVEERKHRYGNGNKYAWLIAAAEAAEAGIAEDEALEAEENVDEEPDEEEFDGSLDNPAFAPDLMTARRKMLEAAWGFKIDPPTGRNV